LVDATGATNTDVGHHVIYDLELTTLGVNGGNAGALQSFVGFDFNGNGADAGQLPPIISGFGTSNLAIGGNGRVLAGDFTFLQIAQTLKHSVAQLVAIWMPVSMDHPMVPLELETWRLDRSLISTSGPFLTHLQLAGLLDLHPLVLRPSLSHLLY